MHVTHRVVCRHFVAAVAALSIASFDANAATGNIVIEDGDVERLYEVVNNPANANKTIVLRPGVYTLSTTDSAGAARPRGGGLMLQQGMKLLGSNSYLDADNDGVWDATFDGNPVISGETLIDAAGLSSYQEVGPNGLPEVDCTGSTNPHSFGVGTAIAYRHGNTISRITIVAGASTIAIGPPHSAYLPSKGYVAEISDNVIDNFNFSVPGAAFHHFGCRMRNASSTLLFQKNIVRGHAFGLAIVNGLTNQQGDKPAGPSLRAVVIANHFLANGLGVHSRNTLGTDGGRIELRSTGNLYEFASWGIEVTAGTDLGTQSGANRNQFDLVSSRDTFRGVDVGIVGIGAWRVNMDPSLSSSSGNELRMIVLEDHFEGSEALRVWSLFPEPRAGVDRNNQVTALVRDATSDAHPVSSFRFIDTVSGDTNLVNVVGSDAEFQSSNGTAPAYQQYLVPPNHFDLSGSALHFVPDAAGYAVTAAPGSIDPDMGPALDFSGEPNGPFPGDDDTVEVVLPFAFDFQGQSYDSVHVNADGNLTFGDRDFESSARDVLRLIEYPQPRIAALLADLAPSEAGAVHANTFADKVIITWDAVPSWEAGLVDENTFQIVLHDNGTIDVVYGAIGAPNSVVGIARGSGLGTPVAIDFSTAAGAVVGETIYESFVPIVGP